MTRPRSMTIFVRGTPVAQGSLTAFKTKSGRVVTKHAGLGLADWRNAVVDKCRDWLDQGMVWDWPDEQPFQLDIDFYFKRPKSQTKKQRGVVWREKRPDLDKLVRAICDALEIAELVPEDSRIAKLTAEKRYADEGMNEGAAILLRPLGGE